MTKHPAVALLAFGIFWAGSSAFAQSIPPFGLAPSETAQVNLVNIAGSDNDGTAASCTGMITFYDYKGIPLGKSTRFKLGTAQMFSAKLPFSSIPASRARTLIRAEVTGVGVAVSVLAPPSLPPCSLTFSLETYDSITGVTHVFFAGQRK